MADYKPSTVSLITGCDAATVLTHAHWEEGMIRKAQRKLLEEARNFTVCVTPEG